MPPACGNVRSRASSATWDSVPGQGEGLVELVADGEREAADDDEGGQPGQQHPQPAPERRPAQAVQERGHGSPPEWCDGRRWWFRCCAVPDASRSRTVSDAAALGTCDVQITCIAIQAVDRISTRGRQPRPRPPRSRVSTTTAAPAGRRRGQRPPGADPGAADGRRDLGVRRARRQRRQRRGDLRDRRVHPRRLLLQLRRQGRAGAGADPGRRGRPVRRRPSRPWRRSSARSAPARSPTWSPGRSHRLDAFGATGREGVLAQRELLLHAARVPALHRPYREFLARQQRPSCAPCSGRAGAGRAWSSPCPSTLAVEMLLATHAAGADPGAVRRGHRHQRPAGPRAGHHPATADGPAGSGARPARADGSRVRRR